MPCTEPGPELALGRPLRRRAVLLGAAGAAVAAAGCSGGGRTAHPARSGAPTGGTSAPPGAPALPRTRAWRPDPSDVAPDVKLRAVELVEAVGAWPPGGAGTVRARGRVAALGLPPGLADQAGPLLGPARAAALEVVDAQYGGILADSASVLVVCRRWTADAHGSVSADGTTVDVRLSRDRPRWTVTALYPARPGAPAASPPDSARRVQADPRIRLPAAAQADIRSGRVHTSVLDAMLRLAGGYPMDVSVVRSGHPIDVFGTDRPSDHPLGRAFDVWRIDGHAVVSAATSRALITSFMRDAAAAGSYNVGGPVQLTGAARPDQFFSDATHHDHVHVGFDS